MGIVNYQEIRAFTRHCTPNANSEVFSSCVGTPSASGFGISPQSQLWENFLEIIGIYQVPNFPTKPH
jgi:hypothetical protein